MFDLTSACFDRKKQSLSLAFGCSAGFTKQRDQHKNDGYLIFFSLAFVYTQRARAIERGRKRKR